MATSTDVLSMRQDLMRSLRAEFSRQESRDAQAMDLSKETINFLKTLSAAKKGGGAPDTNSIAKLADEFQDYSDLDERYLKITDKWQKQSMQVWKDILEELKHPQTGRKTGGGIGGDFEKILKDLGLAAMVEAIKKLTGRLRTSFKSIETAVEDAEGDIKKTLDRVGKAASSLEEDVSKAAKPTMDKVRKAASTLEDDLKKGSAKVRKFGSTVESDVKNAIEPGGKPKAGTTPEWENILNGVRKVATKASIPALLHIAGSQQEAQGVAALKAHQGNTTFNTTRTVVGSTAKAAGTGRIIGSIAGGVLGAAAGAFIPGADVTGISEVAGGAEGSSLGGAIGSTIGAGIGAIKGAIEAHRAKAEEAPATKAARAKVIAQVTKAATTAAVVAGSSAAAGAKVAKATAAATATALPSTHPAIANAVFDPSSTTGGTGGTQTGNTVDTLYVSNLVVQGNNPYGQQSNGITQAAYTTSGMPGVGGAFGSPMIPTGVAGGTGGWLNGFESLLSSLRDRATNSLGITQGAGNISAGTNIGANAGSTLQAIGNAAGNDQNVQSILTQFAGVESSYNPNAGAGTSSAKGAFQITSPTAKAWIKQYGAQLGITEKNYNPNDPAQQAKLVAAWVKNQSSKDVKAGIAPTSANLYSQYFTGGNKLITADPNAIAASVDPSAAASNPNVFYSNGQPRTVGEVNQFFASRLASQPGYAEALVASNGYSRSHAGQSSNQYASSDTASIGAVSKTNKAAQVVQASAPVGGGVTSATPSLDDIHMYHPDPGMRNANSYISA